MKGFGTLVAVSTALLPLLTAGCSTTGVAIPLETGERTLTADEVPPAALAALEREAAGHPIVAYEQEMRDGRPYYEGEWETDDGEAEATVGAGGEVVEREADVSDEAVPDAVRSAAQAHAGAAPITYSRRTFVFYEVEYTVGDEERELVISPEGRVLSRKSE